MKFIIGLASALLVFLSMSSNVLAEGLPRSDSAQDAKVYIIQPSDGDVVTSPISVVFGLSGMGVAPAGVEKQNTGHHHLLIDVDSIALDSPIKKDEQHRHFGGGQTEVTVELAPGSHTLQLLLADHFHIPHNPPVISEKITITVE